MLDKCWKVAGQLLDISWPVAGQLLDRCWRVAGQLPDSYWTDAGQLLATSEQTVAHMQLALLRLFDESRTQIETTERNSVPLGKQLPTDRPTFRKITVHSYLA
jgi:hypothetical protein